MGQLYTWEPEQCGEKNPEVPVPSARTVPVISIPFLAVTKMLVGCNCSHASEPELLTKNVFQKRLVFHDGTCISYTKSGNTFH